MANLMDNPIFVETHERKAHFLIRGAELERIIRAAACAKCGIEDSDRIRIEISFEDEKASGPLHYKIGTRARITLAEKINE